MKDQEIMDLYWARSEAAITGTAEKYGGYCHTISYNILNSDEDAQECVNDTWLAAWNSMPPHRPGNLAAYLGKITRNLSINRWKRYTAEKRGGSQVDLALAELEDCIPSSASVEQIAEDRALVDSINRFLCAQPQQKRSIFIRRYWYLYSIRDIAEAYEMRESKAASMLFRMRKELRAHLEKEGISL
ncbi:MAG: RNA polymerase sigma factor [Oscillospiraceae bacterium]|nr:RNA polymerase sigma factor [Oscillospiraceae bacterium]